MEQSIRTTTESVSPITPRPASYPPFHHSQVPSRPVVTETRMLMDLSSDETSRLGDELFLVAPRGAPQSNRSVHRPSPRRPRAISTGQEESHFAGSGSSLMMSNSFPSYYTTGASYVHTTTTNDTRPILPIVSPTKVRVARRPRGGDASIDDPPSIQNISLIGEAENLHSAFAPIRDDSDDLLEDQTESRRIHIPTIGLRPRALKRPIDDFNSCGAREAGEDDGS